MYNYKNTYFIYCFFSVIAAARPIVIATCVIKGVQSSILSIILYTFLSQ